MIDLGADRLGKRGDDFYELLIEVHRDLNETESARLNARLVLIMANAIGDYARLKEVLERARLR